MGTLNFTVGAYCRDGNKNVMSGSVSTSDAFTTSTSAANVADGSGAVTLTPGSIVRLTASEAMWVRFGGSAATVGDGHYLLAETPYEFEIDAASAGTFSAIDVA